MCVISIHTLDEGSHLANRVIIRIDVGRILRKILVGVNYSSDIQIAYRGFADGIVVGVDISGVLAYGGQTKSPKLAA